MSDKMFDTLLDRALEQAGRRGEAEYLLKEWLDIHDTDCRYDHHGYCQEHYLQPKGECVVELTRNFLNKD
jgi:hypothetical protein